MSHVDVVIVGAGPAGSTAARILARAGASVLLIDREKFPRDKCCAGWVSALAFKEFPELAEKGTSKKGTVPLTPLGGLSPFLQSPFPPFVENPFRGLVFHSPDLETTAEWSDAEPAGYQVNRAAFDAALIEMAREAGAALVLGEAVTEIAETDSGVTVATASGRTLAAKLLIGADGANSFVARSLGLVQDLAAGDFVGCVNENIELGEERVAAIFGPERPIHVALAYNFLAGYAWIFPKKSSIAVGLGGRGLAGEKARVRYREFFADMQHRGLIPKDAASTSCAGAVEPAGVALKAKALVSKRAILVGDAGGFVSAASGEGIYPGMLSAKIAAEVVLKALGGKGDSPPDGNKPFDRLRAPSGVEGGTVPFSALAQFDASWRARLGKHLAMPNVNLTLMLPLIFTDKRVTAKFARAFLFGEKF
jgi:geranylgeranyl reductase family protein